MAKQKRKIIASFLAVMLLISAILSGCGQNAQDAPADADTPSVTESTDVQESEETQTEVAEPQPTEEPAPTEESAAELSGTYLFEMEQGDSLEFKYSDYNSDYEVGNRITLRIEMESAGAYNGGIGCCVGSNYDWQQEDFDFQSGSNTLTWTVTPSLDSAQLSIWFAENGSVGIVSIDVVIEDVEPAIIGKLATFTEQDTFEFTFSEFNSEYKVGDLVKISVVMESDGDFNGSIGASVGRDYTWNQKEFSYDEGGKYTLTWTVKPSSDYSNIGIWWVGGTSVGIHSVTVTILEEEIGIHGDYITLLTDEGNFEFIPSIINPSFKFGDKIRIKVTLESDGEFTGSLGTCVGGDYEWTQVEYESDAGISTWVLDISPVIDSVQLGIWYIGGTAVGIQNIEIEMLTWGYQHKNVAGLIYTATKNNESYTFKPSDYCDFEDGDVITIRVELDSNDVYNGNLSVNDTEGVNRSKTFSSNGGSVVCELVVKGNTKEEAKIDFWWMNTKVALNAITVTKGGTIVDTNGDDIFHPGETMKYRTSSDYCNYTSGDTITVAVTLSGDGYFNGALGMAGSSWIQEDFESQDGSPVTCTITVPGAISAERDIMIGVWWSEGSYVKIEKVTVTKAPGSSEDDNKPTEDDKIDTSNWQLAFNGFTTEWGGWQSVNGSAGILEYSATVADIMKANNITDISDFGGFIFQIWHIDSKDDGKTYTYKLDINGKIYEGEGTININEFNGTDVIQLSKDDYAFSPTDKITGVITVAEGGEQQPDTPSSVVTIFKDGKTDEAYESSDASWLVDAADDAVITLVYTCDDATHAGWNILSWGASVGDDWMDGPGYNADGTNASKEMTLKTTAGALRAALGIKSDSEVTFIKLGAWNGGRIISLNIAESSGTEEPEKPTATLKNTDTDKTFSFLLSDYISDLAIGDVVEIVARFESTSTDGWGGGLGAACAGAENSWDQVQFSNDNPEVSLTVTVPATDEGNPNTGAQIQLWWGDENADINAYIVSVTRKENPDVPEEPETPAATLRNTDADKTFSFLLSDYISDLAIGDVVEIVARFESTSTDGWGGGLGAACAGAENSWDQVQFSNDNPEVSLTVTVPATDDGNPNTGAQIQLWWGDENADINAYIVSVTRKENTVSTITKSNSLVLNGETKKNVPVSSDSNIDDAASVSGNESVSGNNSSDTVGGSIATVSGNDAGIE